MSRSYHKRRFGVAITLMDDKVYKRYYNRKIRYSFKQSRDEDPIIWYASIRSNQSGGTLYWDKDPGFKTLKRLINSEGFRNRRFYLFYRK